MFKVILPLIAFALCAALTALVFRTRIAPLLRSVYLGFAGGFAALCFFEISARASGWNIAADAVIYCALAYCHFHFVNMGETARRIRILRELDENRGGLSREEILDRYNAVQIVSARLGRLERSGQIKLKDGRYVSSAGTMTGMAALLDFMKVLLLRRKREF